MFLILLLYTDLCYNMGIGWDICFPQGLFPDLLNSKETLMLFFPNSKILQIKDRNICSVKLQTSKNLENYGPSWSGTRATLTPTKKASGNASNILRMSNSSLYVASNVSKIIVSFQICKKKSCYWYSFALLQ